MKSENRLDLIVRRLEEMQFHPTNILGICFFIGLRANYLSLDQQNQMKSDEERIDYLLTNRSKYMEEEKLEKLINNINDPKKCYKKFPCAQIMGLFKSLAYYLEMEMPDGRFSKDQLIEQSEECGFGDLLNLNPKKPEQKIAELCSIDPKNKAHKGEITLRENQEIFDNFFYWIGHALKYEPLILNKEKKPSIESNEEAFAFSTLILGGYNNSDPMGLTYFLEQIILPPVYALIIDTSSNNPFHGSLLETGTPFEIALASFIRGLPNEMNKIIWDESKPIFYNQKTLEKINSELVFAPIEYSIKAYQSQIDARWKTPKIINYFKENKHLFENEHNQIESFKRKDGESLMETIFRVIKDRWGFSKENVTTISPNMVFLAIFHFTFIYAWIALIEDSNFIEDTKILN